jgi:hypothetical protein
MTAGNGKCQRCGGPTKGRDVFSGGHRYHLDCVDYLLACQAELCQALKLALALLRETWKDNPQHPVWKIGLEALAKAKGETPNG